MVMDSVFMSSPGGVAAWSPQADSKKRCRKRKNPPSRNGGFFKFGSSTWARTRDLRIDRAQDPQTARRTVRLEKSGCPARRPATEMSSSSASQCKPPLLSSTWARCSALASSRRGNQANGAAMVHSSDTLTHMVSSSKRSALGEVVIPGPFDQILVCCNHGLQVPQSTGLSTASWSVVSASNGILGIAGIAWRTGSDKVVDAIEAPIIHHKL